MNGGKCPAPGGNRPTRRGNRPTRRGNRPTRRPPPIAQQWVRCEFGIPARGELVGSQIPFGPWLGRSSEERDSWRAACPVLDGGNDRQHLSPPLPPRPPARLPAGCARRECG